MSIDEAVNAVRDLYDKAIESNRTGEILTVNGRAYRGIREPVAWALYQVWEADLKGDDRLGQESHGSEYGEMRR